MNHDQPVADSVVEATHHHVGLTVADFAKQARWYETVFGLREVASHQPSPLIRTAVLRAPNGLQLELIEAKGSERIRAFADAQDAAFVEGYGHWAIEVRDAVAAFHHLLAHGASAARAPMAGPTGLPFAYVKDPEGNLIELIER
jgi:catechol 2,3-dioxygenase-like lactoylglutathione lyase family enzyme